MPRVTEVSAQLPHAPVKESGGYGFKVWNTRRANRFNRYARMLVENKASIDELRFAAEEVSEYLAEQIPENAGPLPRGYTFALTRLGERSLAREGVLLAPSCMEPAAERGALETLGLDLKTGWLYELQSIVSWAENEGSKSKKMRDL